jgi:hypothetical protein
VFGAMKARFLKNFDEKIILFFDHTNTIKVEPFYFIKNLV